MHSNEPLLPLESNTGSIHIEEVDDDYVTTAPGCLSRLFNRIQHPSNGASYAHTVVLLKNIMRDLYTLMDRAASEEKKKKQYAMKLALDGRRDLALKCLKTARHYRSVHDNWFSMRENVERLKVEMVSQAQTATVVKGFSRANKVMGRLMKDVNVDSVEKMMETLSDRLQDGRHIASIMTESLDDGIVFDEDELKLELETLIEVDHHHQQHTEIIELPSVPDKRHKLESKKQAIIV